MLFWRTCTNLSHWPDHWKKIASPSDAALRPHLPPSHGLHCYSRRSGPGGSRSLSLDRRSPCSGSFQRLQTLGCDHSSSTVTLPGTETNRHALDLESARPLDFSVFFEISRSFEADVRDVRLLETIILPWNWITRQVYLLFERFRGDSHGDRKSSSRLNFSLWDNESKEMELREAHTQVAHCFLW